MANICPVCQKDDAVQRVATLVAAGQSSGTFSGPTGGVTYSNGKWGSVGGFTTLSGSASSDLARLLAQPAAPHLDEGIIEGVFGYLLVVATLFPLVCGLTAAGGISFLSYLPYILLLGIPAVMLLVRAGNKRKAAAEQRPLLMAKLAKATDCWQRLYFCFRDGVVFDPATNEHFDPALLEKYIYR